MFSSKICFLNHFIYLILAVLDLHCCTGNFSLVEASLVAEDRLQGAWASVTATRGLSSCGSQVLESRLNSCGEWAQLLCGIWELPRSRSNQCLLHWQVEFLPLSHQEVCYMLILCPTTLLNSFINSSSFVWSLQGFIYIQYNVICIYDNFTSSLSVQIPCISFSCLIAVARTSNTMLNRSGKSGSPCLVLDFS